MAVSPLEGPPRVGSLAMTESTVGERVRPYDPGTDRSSLWALKESFERELGAGGGSEKRAKYDAKLDADYRDRYLSWVDRCVDKEDCVVVAVAGDELVGYVFVLPATLSMIWDAAVVNELFVRPAFRGTGVADALFEAGLDHAREQELPLDRVVFDVADENDRARAFYARHGFDHWAGMVAREL